jgi:hypothetical protein
VTTRPASAADATLREYIREGGLFNENPTDRLGL